MLWCKDTFEQHFDRNECRLFPLQQQLFDFVDRAARTSAAHSDSGSCLWLCFSIEFPSASEVSRLLSRHPACPSSTPLFRLRHGSHAEEARACGQRKRVREDFALLYGEDALSQQNRMFLAATLAGLRAVLSTIESRQLHLYEIIRDGTPCHLYFDVEREGDHVALRSPICVDSDSDSSSVVAGDEMSVVVVETETAAGKRETEFECEVGRYQELCRRAAQVPLEACGLHCAVVPDNRSTCDTLLTQLETFIRSRELDLLPSRLEASASVFEEVWVLESVPLTGASAKFSQHYVIKLRGTVFDSTTSVKVLVRQFVAHLSQLAAGCRSLHSSLFFHGSPVWYAVFAELAPDYPRNTLPYLPRRCVVDEAVYSKNRMMRCLGSCKLGKSSVLRVHRHYRGGVVLPEGESATLSATGQLERFLSTLISYRPTPGEATHLLHLAQEAAAPEAHDQPPLHRPFSKKASETQTWREPIALAGDVSLARIACALGAVYSAVAQRECTVSRPRMLEERFITFQVAGTRYCRRIGREHKSNNVYLVVDLDKNSFVQKCFDPDCASYRSPPISLEEALRQI